MLAWTCVDANALSVNGECDAVVSEGEVGGVDERGGGRRFCQRRQNPHVAPACGGLLEQNLAAAADECMSLSEQLGLRPRAFFGKPRGIGRGAERADGAEAALWLSRDADERAEVHKGGIENAGAAFRNQLRGEIPDGGVAGGGIDRELQVKQASEKTRDVGFDNWHRLIEGEGGDGVRRVAAEAGEGADVGWVFWEFAGKFRDHGARGGVEISGAGVVAEALPGVKDLRFISSREAGEIRKPPEPLSIIREHGGDLRLLEHDLGDEDGVGIGGPAPGQVASVFSKPAQKRPAKRG